MQPNLTYRLYSCGSSSHGSKILKFVWGVFIEHFQKKNGYLNYSEIKREPWQNLYRNEKTSPSSEDLVLYFPLLHITPTLTPTPHTHLMETTGEKSNHLEEDIKLLNELFRSLRRPITSPNN